MSDKYLTIPKQVAALFDGLKLTPIAEVIKLPDEQRIEHAALGGQLELIGVFYTGFSLLDLKEKMGHGKYLAALAIHSISPVSAWRAQNIAKLSLRVDASNFSALKNLNPTKLALMVKWEDDELNSFFAGEEIRGLTYDDAVVIPSREMEQRLKEAQRSESELEQQLNKALQRSELAEEQVRLLKRKHSNLGQFRYPHSIDKIRVESSIMSAQAISYLDDFEQLIVELNSASDLSHEPSERDAQVSAGTGALYINIKAIQAKATYLLGVFSESVDPSFIPEKPEDIPVMDESEATRIHSTHQFLLAQSRVDKKAR